MPLGLAQTPGWLFREWRIMTKYTFGFLGLFAFLVLSGCAEAPLDYPRTASIAFRSPQETELGRAVEAQAAAHPGESGLLLLPMGPEAIVTRVKMAELAQKSIDMQYFIFEDDVVGNLLLSRVLAAADRGVRVRLLLDDYYQPARDKWWAAIDSHPNIEVRMFNPIGSCRSWSMSRPLYFVFGPERIRGRMHNKAMLVDGAVVIVGGRNIADEYFGVNEVFNFADQDMLAIGPAACEASDVFDQYWNSPVSIPVQAFAKACPGDLDEVRAGVARRVESAKDSPYAERLRESELLKQIEARQVPWIWAQADVLADHPGKALLRIECDPSCFMATRLKSALDSAQREVLMVSPYLVAGERGVDWLARARDRGVCVKTITNSLASTDVPATQGGYERYRKDMLRAGVEMYELRPDPERTETERQLSANEARNALHAKILVIDREWIFVGSFNLDPRSARLDTQNGTLIRNPKLAAEMATRFDKATSPRYTYRVTLEEGSLKWTSQKAGQKIEYHHDPETSACQRFQARFLASLAPEKWL